MPCVRCHQRKGDSDEIWYWAASKRHEGLRLITGHGRYTDDIISSRRVK
jgi:hypothetical protein